MHSPPLCLLSRKNRLLAVRTVAVRIGLPVDIREEQATGPFSTLQTFTIHHTREHSQVLTIHCQWICSFLSREIAVSPDLRLLSPSARSNTRYSCCFNTKNSTSPPRDSPQFAAFVDFARRVKYSFYVSRIHCPFAAKNPRCRYDSRFHHVDDRYCLNFFGKNA